MNSEVKISFCEFKNISVFKEPEGVNFIFPEEYDYLREFDVCISLMKNKKDISNSVIENCIFNGIDLRDKLIIAGTIISD